MDTRPTGCPSTKRYPSNYQGDRQPTNAPSSHQPRSGAPSRPSNDQRNLHTHVPSNTATASGTASSSSTLRVSSGNKYLSFRDNWDSGKNHTKEEVLEGLRLLNNDLSSREIYGMKGICLAEGTEEDKAFFDKLNQSAEPLISSFRPHEAAKFICALARIEGYVSEDSINKLINHICHSIMKFDSKDLCDVAWAFAKLGIYDKNLFKSISTVADTKLGTFSGSEIAKIAWAYAMIDGLQDEGTGGRSLVRNFIGKLTNEIPNKSSMYTDIDRTQLKQFHLYLTKVRNHPCNWDQKFVDQITQATVKQSKEGAHPSRFQGEVEAVFKSVFPTLFQGYDKSGLTSEYVDEAETGYSIDLTYHDKNTGRKYAFEMDGPQHFRSRDGVTYNQTTNFKTLILLKHEWVLIRIPKSEWKTKSSQVSKKEYLSGLVMEAMKVESTALNIITQGRPRSDSTGSGDSDSENIISDSNVSERGSAAESSSGRTTPDGSGRTTPDGSEEDSTVDSGRTTPDSSMGSAAGASEVHSAGGSGRTTPEPDSESTPVGSEQVSETVQPVEKPQARVVNQQEDLNPVGHNNMAGVHEVRPITARGVTLSVLTRVAAAAITFSVAALLYYEGDE